VIAEFGSDLIKVRTWEGMKVANAKGRLRGKRPKLKPAQEARLVELWHAGTHTGTELFSVACPTVCRAVQRDGTTWGPPSVSGRIFAAKPGATPNSGVTVTARCAALPD
jgi:DNA invertase Pin-like site-specific DNA recombinase